jgi:hypothetical protein
MLTEVLSLMMGQMEVVFTLQVKAGLRRDQLPQASTCFNELRVCGEWTREELFEKLDRAIELAAESGFGLA